MIADGKHIANILEQQLAEKLVHLLPKKVCFILFGDNAASRQFIGMKSKVAARLGIVAHTYEYPGTISNADALSVVTNIATKDYSGIVIQLPLPSHLDKQMLLNSVPSELDIDVLNIETQQHYKTGLSHKIPPVARAIFEILNFYEVNIADKENPKRIVVVGNGSLVGQPVSMTLEAKDILYTMVDIHTPEYEKLRLLMSADIIISGVGQPGLITPEMIQPGVILLDAGTSEQHGKLVGDIDPMCAEKAALITPVPGGIGPVTVISLFLNLV